MVGKAAAQLTSVIGRTCDDLHHISTYVRTSVLLPSILSTHRGNCPTHPYSRRLSKRYGRR